MNTKKPELVAPAGDMEKLKVAFHFGADAVYAGLKEFSLRAKTKNFGLDEIKGAIDYTHSINKKIYIAMNIYFLPDDMDILINYLKILEKLNPDGLIISDLGAFYLAKRHAPNIPLHISTQANITNQYAALFLKELGAGRIIIARELTLEDIKKIRNSPGCSLDITLEAFIHGAMCIAYSGRCLLSAYMTHPELGRRQDIESAEIRSANKGDCAHSCRWEYSLKEKTRGEQEYLMSEDETGSYVFSSKDICMIDHIGNLINAGVSSFKIEGRMKSILYISSIVRAYRRAIDHQADSSIEYNYEEIKNELEVVSHREFSTGFFYDSPKKNANTTKGGVYKRKIRLAAMITGNNGDKALLKIYNTITDKDKIEFIAPDMKTVKIGKITFYDKEGKRIGKVNHTDYAEAEMHDKKGNPITFSRFDILRMEADF